MARRRPAKPTTLTSGLERFEAFSARTGAAALALWPPNAHRHTALSALADALRTPDALEGAEPMQASHWRRWLASRSSAKLRATHPDGMHDEPLSAQAVIGGERFSLLAGALESPDLQLALWYEALATLAAEGDARCAEAVRLLDAVVWLSDRAVEISGIGACQWPDHSADKQIVVPDDETFERLCAAFTVDAEEAAQAGDALDPLAGTGLFCPLAASPEGQLLIADPWHLTQAGLVQALAVAAKSEQVPGLVAEVERRAMQIAVEAAQDMDWQVTQTGPDALLATADVGCLIVIGVHVLAPCAEATGQAHRLDPASLRQAAANLAQFARQQGAEHALMALVDDSRPVLLPSEHPLTEDQGPRAMELHDLRLVGDALRRDPLALPSLLERLPAPPWPEGIDLADVVGIRRRLEEPVPRRKQLPQDGTEHLRLRARVMAARHPAPDPNGTWQEVSRWSGSPDGALFTARALGRFGILVRAPGRFVWVLAADASAGRRDLPGALCTMLAHWLARLCEQGWLLPYAEAVGSELMTAVQLEVCDGPGPALVACEDGRGDLRLIIGPAFIVELCRGDNRADRTLIRAVLAVAPDRPPPDQVALLEQVAPEGRGTFMIWPSPEDRSNSPRLEPPPLIAPRTRQRVEAELAGQVVPEHQIVARGADDAKPGIDDLQLRLDALIGARLQNLTPEAILELVALHERALVQTTVEAVGLPSRDALAGADEHLGPREADEGRDLALRALIERTSALPPSGQSPLSERDASWLRAAAELQLHLGASSDALHSGQATGQVIVGPRLGVVLALEGTLRGATDQFHEQHQMAAPDLMALEHDDWWTTEPAPAPELRLDQPIELSDLTLRAVDRALSDKWGVSYEQLLRLLRSLSNLADERPTAVAVSEPEALAQSLREMTAIRLDTVDAALLRLTLGPDDGYTVMAPAHRPWRTNRERSYLRCPLVRLADGRLGWSALHALASARFLTGLIDSGRLRGAAELRRAVGRHSQALDREFEAVVATHAREHAWQTRSRLKRLGGRLLERVRGQGIGDIDVLAYSPQRGQVWLLDAKRLAPGLDAGAMVREARALEEHVEHHAERLRWVRDHPDQLVAEIGPPARGSWRVDAALVLSGPLAGAHLQRLRLPAWTLWEMPGQLRRPTGRTAVAEHSPRS